MARKGRPKKESVVVQKEVEKTPVADTVIPKWLEIAFSNGEVYRVSAQRVVDHMVRNGYCTGTDALREVDIVGYASARMEWADFRDGAIGIVVPVCDKGKEWPVANKKLVGG